MIVAVAVDGDGRREVLGMTIGASEAETFRTDLLRSLARRGLRGVRLVISDAHEGLKVAVGKVLHASWQPRALPGQRPGARRQERTARRLGLFSPPPSQEDAATARAQWRQVADQLRPKDCEARRTEGDVLAFMSFPKDHRPNIHRTNPLERCNGEIKRRTRSPASFRTKTSSPGWSAPSSSSRTMNGSSSAPDT